MILLTRDWSQYLLERMHFVKRKANTKAKITVENFTELKCNFLSDIQAVVDMEDVPPCLIINWDHTALKYVPVGSWTMTREAAKGIAGLSVRSPQFLVPHWKDIFCCHK